MLVEVVEELLVVVELRVPLARLRVAKVVTERNQKNGRTEETGLLAVLIQQEERSEAVDRDLWVYSRLCCRQIWPRPPLTSPGHSVP